MVAWLVFSIELCRRGVMMMPKTTFNFHQLRQAALVLLKLLSVTLQPQISS